MLLFYSVTHLPNLSNGPPFSLFPTNQDRIQTYPSHSVSFQWHVTQLSMHACTPLGSTTPFYSLSLKPSRSLLLSKHKGSCQRMLHILTSRQSTVPTVLGPLRCVPPASPLSESKANHVKTDKRIRKPTSRLRIRQMSWDAMYHHAGDHMSKRLSS